MDTKITTCELGCEIDRILIGGQKYIQEFKNKAEAQRNKKQEEIFKRAISYFPEFKQWTR